MKRARSGQTREAAARRRGNVFTAVAAHALAHRPMAARVAGDLAANEQLAERKQVCAWLTHTNLAARRGRQHRNTSRDILRELQELGLVKYWAWRYSTGIRFTIRWKAVFDYAKRHNVGAMSNAAAKARGVVVRTVADWQADREADKARKAEQDRQHAAEQAEQTRRRLEADRRDAAALTPQQRQAMARQLRDLTRRG